MSDSTSSPGHEQLSGVFSMETENKIGAGATRRKVKTTTYYFVESIEDGVVHYRTLNGFFVPTGNCQKMPAEAFVAHYKPEPEVYEQKTLPALKQVAKLLAKAERLRSQGQPFSAEVEFKKVLGLDESNVRGIYGLGLTFLDQGKTEDAGGLLKNLVRLDDAFKADNKHMFNEFGIKLRKSKMYDQALAYYASAYKHARNDENLCYNIARTLYDKGDMEKAAIYVKKALEIRPDFPEAAKMLAAIERLLAKSGAPAA